jgi:general secretion pathway protein L
MPMRNMIEIKNAIQRTASLFTQVEVNTFSAQTAELVLPNNWPENSGPIRWRLLTEQGAIATDTVNDISLLPADISDREMIVWVPSSVCYVTEIKLPTSSHKKILQALPYALEDYLLENPESLHYAYSQKSQGELLVVVLSHERMREWAKPLTEHHINITAMCPTLFSVPENPNGWAIAFTHDETLVRTSQTQGFGAKWNGVNPPELISAALDQEKENGRQPKSIVIYNPPSEFNKSLWSDAFKAQDILVESRPIWEISRNSNIPINLLQGKYEIKESSRGFIRPYKPAILLFLIWIVSAFIFDISKWTYFTYKNYSVSGEMKSILKESFPEATPIIDPYKQFIKHSQISKGKSTGHAGNEFLHFLDNSVTALIQYKFDSIGNIQYRNNKLSLLIKHKSPIDFSSLSEILLKSGIKAKQATQTRKKDIYESQIEFSHLNK